jgi:hypothetical protein
MRLLTHGRIDGRYDGRVGSRIPHTTQINLSVRLSVLACLQIRYSEEKGTGPKDSIKYS